MTTNDDAALGLTIILKHLFHELEAKQILPYPERARMLDSVRVEIGQALDGGERFHAAMSVIGDLWD
jgi:hypothetical protein